MMDLLRVVLPLCVLCALPLAAEPAARWDNSAVDGAGLPSFGYELIPSFPGSKFPVAVHSEPYVISGQQRLLISARFGQIYDGPARSEAGVPQAVIHLREPIGQLLGVDSQKVNLHLLSTLFDQQFAERPYLYAFTKIVAPGSGARPHPAPGGGRV